MRSTSGNPFRPNGREASTNSRTILCIVAYSMEPSATVCEAGAA